MSRLLRVRAITPLVVLMLLPLPASPQQSAQQPSQRPEDVVETLKVDVNVVNLFFNVKDGRGALIPGLGRDDFRVFEEGTEQKIKYFAADTNQPLTLGILIDTSGSQQRVLNMEQEVGAAFLREVLREKKDLAFVISFDISVDLLQDFTDSPRLLRTALERTKINTGTGGGGPPGLGGGPFPAGRPRGTLLYDAVYLASREKLAREVGRKAVIILTDGQDQGSQMNIQNAIEAAQKADTICYVLLIEDRGFYGGFYGGDKAMKKLAEESGGRVIDVGRSEKKLREAFDQIAAELRSQYSIGYTPINARRDGSFRRVEVRPARSGLKVQARLGYYAQQAP